MGSLASELTGNDITGALIDAKVKFAIVSVLWRLAQLAHMNLEASAIDDQMDLVPTLRGA